MLFVTAPGLCAFAGTEVDDIHTTEK